MRCSVAHFCTAAARCPAGGTTVRFRRLRVPGRPGTPADGSPGRAEPGPVTARDQDTAQVPPLSVNAVGEALVLPLLAWKPMVTEPPDGMLLV